MTDKPSRDFFYSKRNKKRMKHEQKERQAREYRRGSDVPYGSYVPPIKGVVLTDKVMWA